MKGYEVVFEYSDGTRKGFADTKEKKIRGARRDGTRPVEAFVDRDIVPDEVFYNSILLAISPTSDLGYTELYTAVDKYVMRSGRPVEVMKYTFCSTNDEFFVPAEDGSKILYEEHLDGPLLDRDTAQNLYPEWFI